MNAQHQVIYQPVGTLQPACRNARTHSKRQIRQIADSIREFGFTSPILVDSEGTVIAGHGRLEAAKHLGLSTVPTLCLDHMTEAQKKAYAIADNRLAEVAGWDREILALELNDLIEIDADFDLSLTGFEAPEIDVILETEHDGDNDPADRMPEADHGSPPITGLGDIWRLGRHRLLCGDATSADDFDRVMQNEIARLAFGDLPYNALINGHVSGLGTVRHREFAMASGEMDDATFRQFLEQTLMLHRRYSLDGSIHFICMDWRHCGLLLEAVKGIYSELKNICAWVKANAGMGSLYRSQHEFIFVFKNGKKPHINNVELGRHGRHRSNVWNYAGVNSFGTGRDELLAMHPTVKPVQLVADAILDCSNRGDLVLDGFAGSGTTIIACERTGRRARALEIDPLYCDTIVRRWEAFTGDCAVHAQSGRSFAEIAEQRRQTPALIGPAKGVNHD